MRAAAGRVAGEGRIDVAVRKNKVVALQEGHNLALAAIGEVCSMQQGEGGGSEEALLLAATCGGFNQRRRVPFGEMEPVAADFEPTFEEIELGAFSRAVGAFDDEERSRISAAGNRASRLRERGFRDFGPDNPDRGVLIFHRRTSVTRFLRVVSHC